MTTLYDLEPDVIANDTTAELIDVWRRSRRYQQFLRAAYIATTLDKDVYVASHAQQYGVYMRAEAMAGTELHKRHAERRLDKLTPVDLDKYADALLKKIAMQIVQKSFDNMFKPTKAEKMKWPKVEWPKF